MEASCQQFYTIRLFVMVDYGENAFRSAGEFLAAIPQTATMKNGK